MNIARESWTAADHVIAELHAQQCDCCKAALLALDVMRQREKVVRRYAHMWEGITWIAMLAWCVLAFAFATR